TMALAFGPISSDLALGQFALIAVTALTITAWSFGRARIQIVTSIGMVLTALQPTILPPILTWWRTWRTIHVQLAPITIYLLLWIFLGTTTALPTIAQYFTLVHDHANAERFAIIQYTPAAIAYGFGFPEHLALILGALVTIATCIIILAVALIPKHISALTTFAFLCAVTPLALPFFHEHDFSIAFPAIIIALKTPEADAGDDQSDTIAWILSAALLIGIDWLGLAQRPDGAIQSGLLAAAFLCAGFTASGTARRLLIPGVVLILLILAAVATQNHPAPIWPDTMHAFTPQSNATVAAIWHSEQSTSGMFERNILWAALRCLPLIGCVLLAILVFPR